MPLKNNRLVDDAQGVEKFRAVDSLQWSGEELETDKTVKINGFSGAVRVQLFQAVISNIKVEYVVTNDPNVQKTDGTPAQITENEVVLTIRGYENKLLFAEKLSSCTENKNSQQA